MVTMTVTMTVKDHNCNHYRYHQLLLPSSFVLLDHFSADAADQVSPKKNLWELLEHILQNECHSCHPMKSVKELQGKMNI